jgi:hypothetical protein
LLIGGIGVVYFEKHEALTRTLFILLFSIGVGFVGAAIPGVLKVKASRWLGLRVDATSGAAFFFLILAVLLHYLGR